MAFEVCIPTGNFTWLHPSLVEEDFKEGLYEIPRLEGSKFGASFRLRVSSSTRDAEINALEKLVDASKAKTEGMERQTAAFSYLLDFQDSSHVSLFDLFPQLPKDPHNPAGPALPPKLIERLRKFDSNQVVAWTSGLQRCHNRVCFVPGGPGAGKNFWNLTLAASMQTEVLYLLDINRPLTDVSNKMVRLYQDMYGDSMKPWSVIRMFCWSYEKRSARLGRLEAMAKELQHRAELKGKGQKPLSQTGPMK